MKKKYFAFTLALKWSGPKSLFSVVKSTFFFFLQYLLVLTVLSSLKKCTLRNHVIVISEGFGKGADTSEYA